jgi:hypothetical protein
MQITQNKAKLKLLNCALIKYTYKITGGVFMGLFGGVGCNNGGIFGGNSTILFFIILFLLLFDGFGYGADCK